MESTSPPPSGIRVEQLETFAVTYPVAGHFKFFDRPNGLPAGRPTVVVKITADNGLVGWGQSVPSPRWSYETPESVRSTIDIYLKPEVLGRDPCDIDGIHAAMNRVIAPSFSIGQPIAKAGIDLALHDLRGKWLGQSLAEQWGRASLPAIRLSWTLNPSHLDEVAGQVATATELGYESFNIKVGPEPTHDWELCRLVRSLAPNAFLWADANGGYDQQAALAMLPRFAELGFAALEQPLPANRLTGYRALRQQRALPILMDESLVSCVELEEFAKLELLDGVAMKVSRCGGLAESARMVRRVQELGLLFFASGLTDPDVSLAASLALFGAFGLATPAALNAPQFLTTSLLREPLQMRLGSLSIPTGIGLGVEIDEKKLSTCP